ncbi:hypothetical protein CSB07_00715 [Candidatus Gracilibacteria bacterium]|nr:MAG: hypothetical protein CSB07_00715 [Candidatus Gracilibacteria bacterium]PIE85026.1 MAG: hypothetical protein CSA08_04260 [Candidatus Gracilibacteria bacterium]
MSIEKEKKISDNEKSNEIGKLDYKTQEVAGKLNEKTGIKKETTIELTDAQLDALRKSVSNNKEKNESNFTENKNESVLSKREGFFSEKSSFKPFKINPEKNTFDQNIDALKYTGKTVLNFSMGVGKGIINTPKDLISLIKGEKVYEKPNLPNEFSN